MHRLTKHQSAYRWRPSRRRKCRDRHMADAGHMAISVSEHPGWISWNKTSKVLSLYQVLPEVRCQCRLSEP